jgi:hypothetical protein
MLHILCNIFYVTQDMELLLYFKNSFLFEQGSRQLAGRFFWPTKC